jgi:hypothetical protein
MEAFKLSSTPLIPDTTAHAMIPFGEELLLITPPPERLGTSAPSSSCLAIYSLTTDLLLRSTRISRLLSVCQTKYPYHCTGLVTRFIASLTQVHMLPSIGILIFTATLGDANTGTDVCIWNWETLEFRGRIAQPVKGLHCSAWPSPRIFISGPADKRGECCILAWSFTEDRVTRFATAPKPMRAFGTLLAINISG